MKLLKNGEQTSLLFGCSVGSTFGLPRLPEQKNISLAVTQGAQSTLGRSAGTHIWTPQTAEEDKYVTDCDSTSIPKDLRTNIFAVQTQCMEHIWTPQTGEADKYDQICH